MTHRLFVAIKPPSETIDELIDVMEGVENARWQSERQIHFTLRFVGEVDSPKANDLVDALAQIRSKPFKIEICGVGHFERKGRPHTLWAGVAPCPELLHLQRAVEYAGRSVGIPAEKRQFAPHVTLARLSASAGSIAPFLTAHGTLHCTPFDVRHFLLFESTLSASGSHYDPVVAFPLR